MATSSVQYFWEKVYYFLCFCHFQSSAKLSAKPEFQYDVKNYNDPNLALFMDIMYSINIFKEKVKN